MVKIYRNQIFAQNQELQFKTLLPLRSCIIEQKQNVSFSSSNWISLQQLFWFIVSWYLWYHFSEENIVANISSNLMKNFKLCDIMDDKVFPMRIVIACCMWIMQYVHIYLFLFFFSLVLCIHFKENCLAGTSQMVS